MTVKLLMQSVNDIVCLSGREPELYEKGILSVDGKESREQNGKAGAVVVKESYKLSMERIRYELSLDYENGVERMLSMPDTESIKHALESKGKSTEK